jgi:predicted AAA+ superfamily ATPase
LIVVCGARQTGKTTLCRQFEGGFAYLSMDDPILRSEYLQLTADDWVAKYPSVIIDEIQKAPQLFDTIKAIHDKGLETRIILTGSAQILLLQNVKETLAGRCLNFELFPLTLPEKFTNNWDEKINLSTMQNWLRHFDFKIFENRPMSDSSYSYKKKSFRIIFITEVCQK